MFSLDDEGKGSCSGVTGQKRRTRQSANPQRRSAQGHSEQSCESSMGEAEKANVGLNKECTSG